MLENYEIDLKLLAIWLAAGSGIVMLGYLLFQSSDLEEEVLKIEVSDENPEPGRDIDIRILENDDIVEASILRINGEEYSQVSNFTYTAPENTERIVLEAEYQGLTARKVIEVKDNLKGSNEDSGSSDNDSSGSNNQSEESETDSSTDESSQDSESDQDQNSGDESGSEDTEEDVSDDFDQQNYEVVLYNPKGDRKFETSDQALVNFSFEIPDNSAYRLRIDNNLYSSGEAGGEVNLIEPLAPGKYEWFVRGIKDQQIFDSEIREFEVKEQASVNIESSNLDGYVLDMSFSLENAEEYRVLVNSETVDEGSTSFRDSFSHKFDSAGTHDVEIQALSNGAVSSSVTRSFSSEAPPNAQINWVKPTSPADTTTPETEFEVDTDAEYDLVYTINEGASATDYSYWEASGSGTQSFSFTPDPLPQGEHDYSVTVRDEHETVIGESSGAFETTAQRDFLQVNDKEYLYDSGEDRHLIRLDLKAYEDLSYDISINGSIVAEEPISGTNVQTSSDLGSLQSGQNYNGEILFESDESSQNLTENISFTAQ
ncbi:MAG: hypothetical protein R6V35_03025 [Candidatus Nanohaloarchaea archaeon]